MVSNTEIEGVAAMAPTRRRPKTTNVFFVAVFDKPFQSFGAWQDGRLLENVREVEGPRTGAFITFPTTQGETRQMKVAISYVSIEQARLNLQQEIPHWDFERVRNDTRAFWNEYLSRIEVEGGTETEQRRFYTDLWHALQGRRIISDVNGKYCDMTGPEPRTGQIPLDDTGKPKFNHYNSDSFWGAQWTLNTLWHLVYPEVAEGFVNSMLMMYKDGGLIPRGPSGGNYTYVMTGASSTPFIVSAYMKGLRDFDVETAYEGLRKNHMPGGIMSKAGYEHNTNIGGGLEYYIDRGYIPHPIAERSYGFHQDGSGQTLEYAYQDWTLAQMAKALGKDTDYQMFMARAQNYRNIWYDSLDWMWIRNMDGNWAKPIDILRYGNGWVEGNAAQYTWWVPQDVQGLIGLMGGGDAFNDKLNSSFEMAREHDFVSAKSHSAGETRQFRRRYINYGNQPCMQTAFMFNYSGAPWLTQYWSRQVVDKVYSGVSPHFGYSGDEDQGLMGSLAVLMKIGLFSMKGGTAIKPVYEIASPIFDRITIHLNQDYYPGGTFTIAVENNGTENVYVQQAKLNGETLDKVWFYHEDIIEGGTLELEMGSEPNKGWGSAAEAVPPGFEDK
jgi:predicted alpha-1,2-mannosidase